MVFYKEVINSVGGNIYLASFVILISFFILSKFFVFICRKFIIDLTKKTKTKVDDIIVKKTNAPISILLMLIGIRLALLPLGLKQNLLDVFGNIIQSLIIVILTYIVVVIVDALIDEWGRKFAEKVEAGVDYEIVSLFHRFSRIFLSLVGLMFVLPVWGIQIGPLIASLGIAGVAVAFALQATLGNVFGGVSLILDKSVKVGDIIRIDAETIGEVIDVGLRSTRIKTFDNEVVIMPNGKLAEMSILNYLQPDPKVRCIVEFGVEYGSDVEQVKKTVLDTINSIPDVLKKPEELKPKVMFMEMGDFALKFRAFFWVSKFDERFPTKEIATTKIYNALRKNKIGIPFPTRTVYMKNLK